MEVTPLIETTRGTARENLHMGAVAVADTRGKVLAAAGDPHLPVFTRSTLKALQALPFMEGGGADVLGFSSEQVAMLCASHSGEPKHVQQVQGMLDKAGVKHTQLLCGCHVPYYVEYGVGPAPEKVDERHHNCSGKHAGFLAYCVQHRLPTENYTDAGHPLQQAIRSHVARAAGVEEGAMAMGIDGCSAPNYALPLANLAQAYARMATGERDGEFGASFARMSSAMTKHPDLVSGTNRNDDAFMRAGRGDWVTKVGADGVQVVASKERGEAFALKIADGNKIAATAAAVEVLDQLGWMDEKQREDLQAWRSAEIRSIKGVQVGARRAVFRIGKL